MVGAGDIAVCSATHDEETAGLLDGIPGTVFALGDNVYENGTIDEFNNCYGPSWGRHKARTRPVAGNHEYNTTNATGYYDYFGAAAGVAQKGFYSYDLGDWHIMALNNYIAMDAGSEQLTWLQADLAATAKPCRLAYYHEPLYSSTTGTGSGGTSTASVRPLFTALYNAGVDVILNGHRHFYERLSPMNPQGQLDTDRGIRHFIVGTGGAVIGDPTNANPLSELRFGSSNHGVLKLYLYADSYAWKFVPVPGKTLSDTGSYACHGFSTGISASQSSVTAVPGVVGSGVTSTITVTVRNGAGQPLAGATVQLAVSPTAGVTLTQPTGPTGANGVVTGTLSSTVLGDKVVTATATLSGQSTVLNQSPTVTVSQPSVITQTLLTAGNSAVNQKVYTTASITPAPNTLVLLAVLGRMAGGVSPSPVVTGGGMATWTLVGSVAFDALGSPTRRLTLYRAMSATPGSGPLTITFSGTQSNAQWIVSQWSGVELSGVNGAGAIVQTGTAGSNAATGLNVTLNPFASPNNAAYGAFGVSRTTAVVNPGSGFTEISEQPSGETTPGDLQAEWRTNDNTVDASWGSLSLTAAAVAVEIKSSSAGVGGVDALQSTLEVSPGTIMAGTTATVTVTARDASGAPVSGATVQLAATGSGNTVSTPGPTNSNGVATGTFSSTIAETKTISATVNGTSLTQHAPVQVTAGAVSPTQSTVTAQPTTILPGGQISSITVTVKDQFDNPVNNASVILSASPPAGVTLTQPGATDAGGVAGGELSSAVAETKTVSASVTVGSVTTPLSQTASITITPQNSSAIVQTLLTAGNNPANAKVYTTASIAPAPNALVTVAVLGRNALGASPSPVVTGGGMASWTEVTSATFDVIGTPTRRISVYRAMSAAPGSGPLTITFSGTQGNAQWIVSQWTGVDETGTNGSGAIVQTGTANGDAVTALNVTLNPFTNVNDVAYGAFGVTRNTAVVNPGTGFIEISEQPSAETTTGDLQAEWRANDNTVDASWVFNLNAAAAALEIRAGASGSGSAVDPNQATFEVSPPVITPGGAAAGIEITVRDAGGVPLPGVVVTLFSTGTGNTLSAPGPTDAAGIYRGTLSSDKAETKVVTATARLGTVTTTLNASGIVTVEPGPVSASQSSLGANPLTIDAGGATSTITVVVHDALLNPIAGASVALSASGSGNTLSAPGLTNANGVFVGTLSSSVPEGKTVSAAVTVGGVVTGITQTATVTVEAGGVSATQSTIGGSPLIITAGDGSSTITVTVKNGAGQPVVGATVQLSATGGGNTLSAPGLTNASGVYTGSLSSTVAGDKVVSASATYGGATTPLSTDITVTAQPGPVSGTQSALAANPLTIGAGTGSSAITVTIRDANDNPIPGASVALSATGSGNTLSAAALTDASGVYTGSVSSTAAGAKVVSAGATVGGVTTPVTQTATVAVTPGAVSSTQSALSSDVTTISADGGTGGVATITVTVRDANLNPISGATVALAAGGPGNTLSAPGLTDANGVYTGTLSSTAAGDKLVSATVTVGVATTPLTQTATITVQHGALSATQSTLTSDLTMIETDVGSATITVTAHDSHGNPIPGATVALAATGTGNTLSAPGTTNASGVYVSALSSTDPGDKIVSATVTIDATSTALAATATVSVKRLVSATVSTIDALPATIDAATGVSTITVTVHDGQGHVIPGASVELLASGSGNTVAPEGLTDASGIYTGTVTSTVAGTKTISASVTYNSVITLLSGTAQVTVTPGPISTDHSTVAAAPTSITRATGSSTITVTVHDEHDNPIAGASVELSATGTGNTLSAAGATNASGVYSGSLSSTDVGEKVVSASATVDGATTALTATATVTVEPGPVSTAQSTVAADPTSLTAGVGSSAITVTVRDAAGNAITGATVTLSATGTENTLSAPGLTDASGVYAGSLSSTVAGEKVVSASVTRGASSTDLTATASVTVVPGSVSATQSTLTATPASIALGTGSATITVTVHDALNNPIPGVSVTLSATGGGNTLSAPGLTNASGVYSGTLSSTVAGDKVISASATAGGTSTTLSPTATVSVLPQVATIGHTLLTSGHNAVNQRIYTTASISPAPNTLVTLAVLGRNPTAASPDPIVTGGGMTAWTVVSSSTFDAVGVPTRRLTVYRAMSATPGSGPITITFNASQGNAQWTVSQWDGVETGGTNGSAAIVQSGSANGDAVTGLAVGLAPFGHANNVAYGAFGVAKNVVSVTPGAGFTEIAEEPSGESTPGDLQTEWAVNLNAVTASWAAVNGAAVGIEIKAHATSVLP